MTRDVELTYFDHAATTPMREEAVEAMLPFLRDRFANPSGSHRASRDARRALDEARDEIADCLGVKAGEIVFTGCGTEADNAAISGVLRQRGGIAVCAATEHHAVLHVVEHTGGRVIGVDSVGRIDLAELESVLVEASAAGSAPGRGDGDRSRAATGDGASAQPVAVVSVMAVNNEAGTIQPLDDVARLVRRHAPGALLHTDAVQAACWLPLPSLTAITDLLALSAHKFGGPKGVGLLWVRDGVTFEPILQGGGQERDRRSGTHNLAGIAAMAAALSITVREREAENLRIAALRDRLVDGLLATCPGAIETVPREHKIAGSAHICFSGCESESLLFLLDQAGICASAASACASGAMEPSHVLAAMGLPRSQTMGAIRFSLGYASTDADVDRAVSAVPAIVERVRGRSPQVGALP